MTNEQCARRIGLSFGHSAFAIFNGVFQAVLEFVEVREPEALFWVFGFPLILALALGFAFRDKAPDRIPVAVLGAKYQWARGAGLL